MALTAAGTGARLAQFLQRPFLSSVSPSWATRTLVSASITIPAISINLPGLISDIWDGILKAVPKKKTSHMKRRHRQLAGKALKDVTAVNTCPGCGQPKRAHLLCPYCVKNIKAKWIGDSQRAIERGESLARAELERQLEAEMQNKSTTESKQEVASTTEKTV